MSGYDPKTGIFQLTEKKANRYLQAAIDPSIKADSLFQYCAQLFRQAGYEVLKIDAYGLYVIADDADVWKVLSGKEAEWGKADPPASEVYARYRLAKEWFNATELGKEFRPALSAIKLNRLLICIDLSIVAPFIFGA